MAFPRCGLVARLLGVVTGVAVVMCVERGLALSLSLCLWVEKQEKALWLGEGWSHLFWCSTHFTIPALLLCSSKKKKGGELTNSFSSSLSFFILFCCGGGDSVLFAFIFSFLLHSNRHGTSCTHTRMRST